MTEKITCDVIIGWLQEKIENKEPVAPDVWLDGCQKLTVLVGDEMSTLYDIEQLIAKQKVHYIENGDSVAKANVKIQALDVYKEMRKQAGKIERIFETIRISKLQAKMASNEWQSQR